MRRAPLSFPGRFKPTRRAVRALGSFAAVCVLTLLPTGPRGLATAQTEEPAGVGSAASETMTRVGVVDLRTLPHAFAATRTGATARRGAPLRFPYTSAAQDAARARAAAFARRPPGTERPSRSLRNPAQLPGNGAQIYAISKKDLLAGAASPHVVHYGNLTIPGAFPAASLQPAQTAGPSAAEYFLSSLDPNATVDARLGVWALTDEAALDTGGKPALSAVFIGSELYGVPPSASQKGSTAQLDTGDDRMQQVQNVNGVLWSSLDTVVFPAGDVESRSGVAWFAVVPYLGAGNKIAGAIILAQGYLGLRGNYLLYPAVSVNNSGRPTMVASLSGTDIFPSVVYTTGSALSTLNLAAVGSAPYTSGTCSPCRWGDYSAAVQDPGSGNAWLATEYIGPRSSFAENWATRVFEVSP